MKLDLAEHIERQKEWSRTTFGPGFRFDGIIDHIKSELKEIEEKPYDLEEWIDVIILALDGAWRSGQTPEKIVDALRAKQIKNENRNWPDWRTADPSKAIEHIKEFNPEIPSETHTPIRIDPDGHGPISDYEMGDTICERCLDLWPRDAYYSTTN